MDIKRHRLLQVLRNEEILDGNGRLRWHNIMEGERPFSVTILGNSQPHCQVSRPARLTFRPADGLS
jgi:hypothetical protein